MARLSEVADTGKGEAVTKPDLTMDTPNIRSNLPWYFMAGRKPTPALCAKYDQDYNQLDRTIRERAKRIELIPGFGETYVEELEAQFEYNKVKNTKKSDPAIYYPAKKKLFAARWKTRSAEEGSPQVITMVNADLHREGVERSIRKHGSIALAWKAWLIEETGVYFRALRHPETVSNLCSANMNIYQQRYSLLTHALRTCLHEGVEAGYALWKDELEERFSSLQGQDVEHFVQLTVKKHGGKDGYWDSWPTSLRPVFVTDPRKIERNKAELAYRESDEFKALKAEMEEVIRQESEHFKACLAIPTGQVPYVEPKLKPRS